MLFINASGPENFTKGKRQNYMEDEPTHAPPVYKPEAVARAILHAATVIFTTGAMLCFAAMLWPHDPVEVQAYWQSAGLGHAFWYTAAAVLGCVGYGSVFLAAGLLLRNPIIPAAVLLGWESINGFLPEILQKLSVLYYLQSLCPVPAPTDKGAPAIIQSLLSPASPASVRIGVTGSKSGFSGRAESTPT